MEHGGENGTNRIKVIEVARDLEDEMVSINGVCEHGERNMKTDQPISLPSQCVFSTYANVRIVPCQCDYPQSCPHLPSSIM